MGIGSNIKELRIKNNLTQKDLAEKLNVTFQAVSRWENNEVEPSVDTINEMTKLFNCSFDEIFGRQQAPSEPKVVEVEKVVVEQAKPVLALCERCNKPIFESSDINRVEYRNRVGYGRHHNYEVVKKVLCSSCNKKRLDEEKRVKHEAYLIACEAQRRKRIHSFVWPSIAALIFIITAICSFNSGETTTGIGGIVLAVTSFTFIATLILNNTFLNEYMLEMCSFGFVKMPGVIMEFSLDGILIGLAIKLFLWLLSFAIGIAVALFGLITSLIMSPFVYIYSIIHSFNEVQEEK